MSALDAPRLRVLVADDDSIQRRLLERLFRTLPIEVVFASSAEEAWKSFNKALEDENPFHGIISDNDMHGEYGVVFLGRVVTFLPAESRPFMVLRTSDDRGTFNPSFFTDNDISYVKKSSSADGVALKESVKLKLDQKSTPVIPPTTPRAVAMRAPLLTRSDSTSFASQYSIGRDDHSEFSSVAKIHPKDPMTPDEEDVATPPKIGTPQDKNPLRWCFFCFSCCAPGTPVNALEEDLPYSG